MPITLEQAKAAKAHALEAFRKVGDVVGVGITRLHGEYAVKVNLRDTPRPGVRVPTSIDGVPVRVEVTGSIKGL